MTWIVVGYSALGIILVWLMTCLWVYGSINKEISADTWHWKLFRSINEKPPRSDCEYTRKLFFTPFGCVVVVVFLMLIYGIGAICCLLKDWIIVPFFLGERIAPVSTRHYLQGLAGQQIEKGDWREVPKRQRFIPFSPAIVVFVGVCLAYAYFASVYVYEHPSLVKETLDTKTIGTLAIIATIFILQKPIRLGLRAGWAKWKEKTCHPISAPDMD